MRKLAKTILVIFGAPAAGKGTQAVILQGDYNIPQLSTGDMLREAIKEDSDYARKLAKVMSSGELVSDDLIITAIKTRISQPDCQNGCIFDGFPRTIDQAIALDKMLTEQGDKISSILNISVGDDELKSRVQNRYQQALDSGKTPRDDDKIEVYTNRLEVYRQKTLPVLAYYKKNHTSITHDFDGTKKITEVTADIRKILR